MTKSISQCQPDSIFQMIGQNQVKRQVINAVDAAIKKNEVFDSPTLLVGPGGCGKSQTARCIANMMNAELTTVLAGSISNTSDLSAVFLQQKADTILFLEESSGLSDEVQLALYLAIDTRKVFVNRKNSAPLALDIENFTLLLATTHEFALNNSCRQRMKLVLRFSFFSIEELAQIIHQRCSAAGIEIDTAAPLEIAKRSKGIPRLALNLLNATLRVASSHDEASITVDHVLSACDLEGIDELGCDSNEQQYLKILLDGPVRLNIISSKMALPSKTIEQVIESDYLIRAGLVTKDEYSRRVLTPSGTKHAKRLLK